MVRTNCGFDTTPTVSGHELLVQYGPTLFVDIGFDATFRIDARPFITPEPGMKNIEALVDTGASISCIDNILAASLNLPMIDRRPISGVHGRGDANVYLAQVHVPTLEFTIYGEFMGVDLQAGGQWHKALIGRTFLKNFTMTYEGRTGSVVISSE